MVNVRYKKAVDNFLKVRDRLKEKGFQTAYRYSFSLPLCFYLVYDIEKAEKEIIKIADISENENGYFNLYKENIRKEFLKNNVG